MPETYSPPFPPEYTGLPDKLRLEVASNCLRRLGKEDEVGRYLTLEEAKDLIDEDFRL